jgi:hypothetical protein
MEVLRIPEAMLAGVVAERCELHTTRGDNFNPITLHIS